MAKGDNFGATTAGSVGKPYRNLTRTVRNPRGVPRVIMQRGAPMNVGDTQGLHPRPPRVPPQSKADTKLTDTIPSYKNGGRVLAYQNGGLVPSPSKVLSCEYGDSNPSKRKG